MFSAGFLIFLDLNKEKILLFGSARKPVENFRTLVRVFFGCWSNHGVLNQLYGARIILKAPQSVSPVRLAKEMLPKIIQKDFLFVKIS